MAENVTFGEAVWRVSRQPGVSVGARAVGDAPPQPQSGGLWFHSDQGESRFLAMSEVPTEAELKDMDIGSLIEHLQRAETQRSGG